MKVIIAILIIIISFSFLKLVFYLLNKIGVIKKFENYAYNFKLTEIRSDDISDILFDKKLDKETISSIYELIKIISKKELKGLNLGFYDLGVGNVSLESKDSLIDMFEGEESVIKAFDYIEENDLGDIIYLTSRKAKGIKIW